MVEVIAGQVNEQRHERCSLPLAGEKASALYGPVSEHELQPEVSDIYGTVNLSQGNVEQDTEPAIRFLSEAIPEQEIRLKAAQFVGSVLASDSIAVDTLAAPNKAPYTLNDAIHEAAGGSQDAYDMVRQNVATDVVERTLKSGHIIKVELSFDKDAIIQHGQSDVDIQANSLRYGSKNPVMRDRMKIESRNMFRRREAYRQGLLNDKVEVVFSFAATEMSEQELEEEGFFKDTMSCAIQATTAEGKALTIESAFVAGKKTWDSGRHDRDTINKLGDMMGVNFRDKSMMEILDSPILVPRNLMPNGVIDIVRIYDECAGGTFFGEEKPVHDYVAYKQKCIEREEAFRPRVSAITQRLIEESPRIKSPEAASIRLGELSEQEMVEQTVMDDSIDPRVFGAAAAWRIEHARAMIASGQVHQLQVVISQAKSMAQSSSCPGGSKMDATDSPEGVGITSLETTSEDSESLDDCEFVSKECPVCHEKNVKTVVKKGKYYGDCGCSA